MGQSSVYLCMHSRQRITGTASTVGALSICFIHLLTAPPKLPYSCSKAVVIGNRMFCKASTSISLMLPPQKFIPILAVFVNQAFRPKYPPPLIACRDPDIGYQQSRKSYASCNQQTTAGNENNCTSVYHNVVNQPHASPSSPKRRFQASMAFCSLKHLCELAPHKHTTLYKGP